MSDQASRSEEQRKTILRDTFDAVAGGYDSHPLRFFPQSAALMASLLAPQGHERVVDVACGTGNAALALAPLLPRGRVTAVDFSAGMLAQARRRAAAAGVDNIDFVEGDMSGLDFAGTSFDAALCAFGIFFAADMSAQLARIAAVVRPGGVVMTSTFAQGYFQPLRDLFFARVADYGVAKPPQTWMQVASEAGCRDLFSQDGLCEVRVERRSLGYHLSAAEDWWAVIWNAGFRRLVNAIAPAEQERFRVEHLREVAALATPRGIWLDVEVLYTSGTIPQRHIEKVCGK
ncbi:MAG: methyltransferase domain-containing protein [Desulfobulbaceae bacterium]|nr:methyltransferase domain-containing protein [Desulfobulbaceae bacterium]